MKESYEWFCYKLLSTKRSILYELKKIFFFNLTAGRYVKIMSVKLFENDIV